MKLRKKTEKKSSNASRRKKNNSYLLSPANIAKNYVEFYKCDNENTTDVPSIMIKDIYENKSYYVSLLSISGIDIFHFNESDREVAYRNFAAASAAINLPHKYIFTDIQPSFVQQKDYLTYKASHSNGFNAVMLNKRYKELGELEMNHRDRSSYMLVFSEEKSKLDDALDMFLYDMKDTIIKVCDEETILRVIRKMMTFETEMPIDNKENFNKYIYPNHIHFETNCFKINDLYASSLVVYDYPAYLLDLVFASYVLQNSDTTIIIDSVKREKGEVAQEIKKSLDELNSRGVMKQNVSDVLDTATEFEKVQDLYNSIANGHEQVYSVTLRFIITDSDKKNLAKKIEKMRHTLEDEGLNSYVPVNQMINEYFTLCLPANKIKNPFPLYDTFSRQFPFYYQQHIDPTGMYFGKTDTNGLVVLNTFTKNNDRPSYDMLAIGVKGGGKSITLKTMLEDRLILGDKVMVLDIEDEYSLMSQVYDGQVIRMTKNSIINPLQINKTIDVSAENSDNANEVMTENEARETNFQSEISRINTFMHQIYPTLSDEEEMKFNELLLICYAKKGINNHTDLTALHNNDYPIFSDILYACEENYKNAETMRDKEICEKLRGILRRLSKGGVFEIFDNYTNVDVQNKNLIVFNVKAISELDEKVYNAQLFNILSLMWTEICKNVDYNRGIINPYDRRNVICLIDEAHRFISENNPQCTLFIEKLVRRSRKYFAGLWFATQSILDFLPQGVGVSSEVSSKIKTIFTLVQYKVILKQDGASLDDLHNAFPQFTVSELKGTTEFIPGEMLLALNSGRMKIHCSRRATDANLLYMGTSQDASHIINKYFDELYIKNNNPNNLKQIDYGKQLLQDHELYNNFLELFSEYTMERLDIPQGACPTIDTLVKQSVEGLARSLMDRAAAIGGIG